MNECPLCGNEFPNPDDATEWGDPIECPECGCEFGSQVFT